MFSAQNTRKAQSRLNPKPSEVFDNLRSTDPNGQRISTASGQKRRKFPPLQEVNYLSRQLEFHQIKQKHQQAVGNIHISDGSAAGYDQMSVYGSLAPDQARFASLESGAYGSTIQPHPVDHDVVTVSDNVNVSELLRVQKAASHYDQQNYFSGPAG